MNTKIIRLTHTIEIWTSQRQILAFLLVSLVLWARAPFILSILGRFLSECFWKERQRFLQCRQAFLSFTWHEHWWQGNHLHAYAYFTVCCRTPSKGSLHVLNKTLKYVDRHFSAEHNTLVSRYLKNKNKLLILQLFIIYYYYYITSYGIHQNELCNDVGVKNIVL